MNIQKIINKNKKYSSKLIASVLTILVLAILVMSGPASAFVLSLTSDVSIAKQPDKITFTAIVDINQNENLPIDEIVLILDNLDGSEHRECSFDITGKMKSGMDTECFGINIKKIAGPSINYSYGYSYGYYEYGYNFGYGYGYTEQTLGYEITLHTQHFSLGEYNSDLKIIINGKEFVKQGSKISILKNTNSENQHSSSGGCSTTWTCSEWSSCVAGTQTRTCSKEKIFCYANPNDKPIEKQTCTLTNQNTETQNNTPQPQVKSQNILQRGLKGITGAVTGVTGAVKGTTGTIGLIVIIVFIVGILGLAVSVSIIRKKRIRRINMSMSKEL